MSQPPVIEIYFDADNSQLPAFRRVLRTALLESSLPPCWQEYYVGWNNVPARLANAAHPALLVNHQVVWKGKSRKSDSSNPAPATKTATFMPEPVCLVPEPATLVPLLSKPPGMKRSIRWGKIFRTNASFMMAVFIAFFPKCPFCWAAYMSIFSFLGLNTISYKPWLLPVFIVLFFANLVSLYFTRKQHGYKLLLLSLAGALLIVLNRLYWNVPAIVYCGAALLVTASLWNSLSTRMANSVRIYLFGKRI